MDSVKLKKLAKLALQLALVVIDLYSAVKRRKPASKSGK